MLAGMVAAATAAQGQGRLLLNELLYQPRSGEAEYVELYNPTATAIDLSEYMIIRWIGDSLGTRYPLPSFVVEPKGLVVLTKDAASVAANYPGTQPARVVECRLPTYPNDGGTVVLADSEGNVVERLDYTPEMHSRLLRNKAGVSLERRRPDLPCNEPSNWFSAASTAGYGTPTQPNSQSTEWLVEEVQFDCSSERVSPDGDEYEDELTIAYSLNDNDIYANIVVYNDSGRPMRRLLNNALLGSHGRVVWDGHGENGQRLRQGRYILIIDLFNRAGIRQTLRRTVALIVP